MGEFVHPGAVLTPAPETHSTPFWFPGRWLGASAMIAAPLLMLAGVLLRIRFNFFFPHQLSAFQQHPTLITAAYSCFLAGNILLWPAIVALARLIGATRPGFALWGGALVVFGLFARTFHAGADHLAFQMVRIEGLPSATRTIADSYGAFHIVAALNAAIFFGWIVLAIGAWLSGTLGIVRSIALGLMSALMMGVLKGSSPTSVIATAGLAIALVPLGVRGFREPPRPPARAVLKWSFLMAALIAAMFYVGRLG